MRIESGVGALDVEDRAQQQPGAEKQHDRERNLRDDERLPQAPGAAAAAGTRVGLERLVQIVRTACSAGRDADQESGRAGEAGAPREHAAVDACPQIEHRQLRRDERNRAFQTGVRAPAPRAARRRRAARSR